VSYSQPRPIREDDEVGHFDCGDDPLNTYLIKKAVSNHRSGASRCFVTCREGRVVGYYALAAGSVERKAVSGRFRRNMPDPIPVILLTRLAVDRREQGKGLGRHLLRDAITRTVYVADHIGARAMLVHAIDEDARNFYSRFDFEQSPTDPLHLLLSIKDARILITPH
jgi:predicted N-acetyltransferase YhbS